MVPSNKKALVIFSRVPELHKRIPEEPYAGLPWTDLDALYLAMLDDTIETVGSLPGVDIFILKIHEEVPHEMLQKLVGKIEIMDLPQTAAGEEIQFTVEVMFGKHYEQVVVLLEPHPLLTKNDFKFAFDLLQYDDDCVVIGQHTNGKFFFIGLKSDHSDVFIRIDEHDSFARNQTILAELCKKEVMVFPLLAKYALDSASNLLRLRNELEEFGPEAMISQRTKTMFKAIDKKYKIRRPK